MSTISQQTSREQYTSSFKMVVGPMYADKSTWLVNQLGKCLSVQLRVLILNSSLDKRVSGECDISTHNPSYNKLPKSIEIKIISSLSEVDVTNYDVIGIDECQWIEDLLIIKDWLKQGKKIYCAGLDGDFNKNGFIKNLGELVPLCNEFRKVCAYCKICGPLMIDAPFTKIIVSPPKEGNYIDDSNNNSFIPVCGYHYEF